MSKPQQSIRLLFRDETRQPELEPLCWAVLEHFALHSQPMCCIFDDEERWEFTSCFGDSFCGFFYPVAQQGLNSSSGCSWPYQIRTNISEVWREIEDGGPSRDLVLVYLRKSTCDRPTGTTITFAHELQHATQRIAHYKAWKAHRWIVNVARSEMVDPKPWLFPTEYEAQLVSKRVAEAILGPVEIKRYASGRILSPDEDPDKWKFFERLDVSQTYDFVGETRRIVERHKEKLAALYQEQPAK